MCHFYTICSRLCNSMSVCIYRLNLFKMLGKWYISQGLIKLTLGACELAHAAVKGT